MLHADSAVLQKNITKCAVHLGLTIVITLRSTSQLKTLQHASQALADQTAVSAALGPSQEGATTPTGGRTACHALATGQRDCQVQQMQASAQVCINHNLQGEMDHASRGGRWWQ